MSYALIAVSFFTVTVLLIAAPAIYRRMP